MVAPSYREELISQIPAARLLISLGYHYLTPQQALGLRAGSERNVLLTGVLEEWLKSHNGYKFKGQDYSFTDNAVKEAVRRLNEVTVLNLRSYLKGRPQNVATGNTPARSVAS